ncbi:MAG: hypothetical protein K5785_02275 [Nitrosarchaeum sp.]|nr:hypothetical protein [Nitrosarchaeum sp.]
MFGKKHVPEKSLLKPNSENKSSGLQNITSFLKRDSVSEPLDKISDVVPECKHEHDASKTRGKSVQLVQKVQQSDDLIIKPLLDYNDGVLFYPILSEIGESPDNVSYLDGLVDDGVLDKQIYEKLIVCPIHPKMFSSSMRLYCPKCQSMNVQKLNLFEHKKCGYITESVNFAFSADANSMCPSCQKEITNFEKEIRVPAMWYQCDDCREKFDNATIKLHCRKYGHDFDPNSGQFITTYSYTLKHSETSINCDVAQIKDEIVNLLNGFNFNAEINYPVKGRTGNIHEIPIYAKSNISDASILIFIKNQADGIDESVMNSILVPKLDIGSENTLLITVSSVKDGIARLAQHYGIFLISEPDFSKILSKVEDFVSNWYTKNGGNK